MKIVNKPKENTVLFSELNPGDVFKGIITDNFYLKAFDKPNAINLVTGEYCGFPDNSKVIPIDCELVIK